MSMGFSKIFVLVNLMLQSFSFAETPETLKKSEEQVRQEMIVISRQLGVTCTECHNVKNFKDSAKNGFKIGQQHLKSVEILKSNGFSGANGEPLASCFMCHQGQLHFAHREKFDDHNRHEKKAQKIKSEETTIKE